MLILDKLIRFIADRHVFSDTKYAELQGVSEEQKFRFALRHMALHFSKTAGKIAAISEAVDHGKPLDREDLKVNVSKSLVNTLRVAELTGLSEDDLIRAVERQFDDSLEV